MDWDLLWTACLTGSAAASYGVNSFPPGQNGCYFAADIFKRIFMNEKFCISIQISLRFVQMGPIDNKSALVQVMAWCRTAAKPLSEPMPTQFNNAYMWH